MKVVLRTKVIMGLSLALTMGIATQATAAQTATDVDVYQVPMHFTFDGKEYAPPEGQQGFIYEGTTYVPIRFISYSLDKAVKWDPATYTVTIEEPKAADKINISEYKMNVQVYSKSTEKFDKSKLTSSNLKVYKEKINYVFDGVGKSPSDELPGYIVDGSLFVPIRFFSESVGKTINWDPETYTVSADTKEETKPEVKPETKPETKPVITAPIGGGGGIVKPSYDSITSEAVVKMFQLKSESSATLNALLDAYKISHDENLKAQGDAVIAEANIKFEQIMSETEAKLGLYGYDTSITDTYRLLYEEAKKNEKDGLEKK